MNEEDGNRQPERNVRVLPRYVVAEMGKVGGLRF
jgi:hypothetical protein